MCVNRLNLLALLSAPGHVGLIRDHDEEKPGTPQTCQRFRSSGGYFHLSRRRRREGLPVLYYRSIQDPVAVKKHGSSHYRVDSHLVCWTFSLGCDTRRCQTTPWNASECGVMVSVFTTGTTTQASATFAV